MEKTMKVQLKNRQASATLHPLRGGLLTDLFLEDSRGEPVDIFWKSSTILDDASGWPMGGMPFLFPFGGRVFHQDQPLRYALASGREYPMPLHGFAYGVPWTLEPTASNPISKPTNRDETSQANKGGQHQVTLVLEDSPTTHVLFPFRFKLRLTYRLEHQKLSVAGSVQSLGGLAEDESDPDSQAGMPVAPGFHPFFKVPLRRGGRPSECFVETHAQTLVRVTPTGVAGKAAPVEPHQIPHSILDRDFQNSILTDLQDTVVHLVDRDHKMSVEMKWPSSDPFKHLVLWTKATDQTPAFYCIEPWTALPDALAPGHGALWLMKNQSIHFNLALRLCDQRR